MRKNQSFITKAFKELFSNTKAKNIYLVHIGPTSKDLIALGRMDSVNKAIDEESRIKFFLGDENFAKHVMLIGYQPQPSPYLRAPPLGCPERFEWWGSEPASR